MLVLKGGHRGYFSLWVPCHIYLRSAWFLSCLQPCNPLLHFFSHLLSLLWCVVNKLPLTNSPTSPLTSCPTPLWTGSVWVHLAGGSAQEIIPKHKYVPAPALLLPGAASANPGGHTLQQNAIPKSRGGEHQQWGRASHEPGTVCWGADTSHSCLSRGFPHAQRQHQVQSRDPDDFGDSFELRQSYGM